MGLEKSEKNMNQSEYRELYYRSATTDAIRQLSAELVRLTRLPYRSWKNFEKIRNLDSQIQYLEEVLAAFEKDKKRQ